MAKKKNKQTNIFKAVLISLAILVVFTIPFVVTETKLMKEKIKRSIEDKMYDLDKRSEEKRHRDEIRRQKDFELANKKLDNKLLKVDKQIKIHEQKLKLAKELKETTVIQKDELQNQDIKQSSQKQILLEKNKKSSLKDIEDEELVIPNDENN